MSDTPETDAALYPMNHVDIVWPEFARKLERERDEARETVEQLTKHGLDLMDANRMLKRKLKQLKSQ